jgi:hypothetical protein
MSPKPIGQCPKAKPRKPRKLSVNQKAAFQSPINPPKRHDDIVPHSARMGVRLNG